MMCRPLRGVPVVRVAVRVVLAVVASASATVFCSLGIQWKRGGVVKSLSKPFAVW